MNVEPKATNGVPDFKPQYMTQVEQMLNAPGNGEKAYLANTDLLNTQKLDFAVSQNHIQSAMFRALRDQQVVDTNGKKIDLPEYDGWAPWGYLKDHVNHPTVYGAVTDETFFGILLHTVDYNEPTHASYMVKDISWNNKGVEEHYVLVRIRPRDDDRNQQRGQGKYYGKSSGQKRARKWGN